MAEERLNPLTWLQGKFEEKSNKVTSWGNLTTDTHYPSEKLVKDYVDAPKEYFEKKSFTKTLDLAKPLDELSNKTGNNRYGNLYDSLNGEWEITVDIGTLSDGQGFGIANSSYDDGLCFGINPLGNSSNHFQVLNLADENELYNGFNLTGGTYSDGNDTSLAVPNSNFTLKISYHTDEPLYYQSDEKTIHIDCYVNGSLNDRIIGYGDLGFCHFETYGDPSLSVQMKTEISYPKLYETPLPFEKINENYAIGVGYGDSKIYDLMECDLTFNKNGDGIQLYSLENLYIEYNNGYLYLKKYDDQQGSFNTIFTIKQGNTCKVITYRLSEKLVYILFEGYWITSNYESTSYGSPPFMYTLINADFSPNNSVTIGSSIDVKFYRPVIPTRTSELVNDSNFLTTHQSITGKEDKSNKVTSLSSSSTDTQYPSAKAVKDNLDLKVNKQEDYLMTVTNGNIILSDYHRKNRWTNEGASGGGITSTTLTSGSQGDAFYVYNFPSSVTSVTMHFLSNTTDAYITPGRGRDEINIDNSQGTTYTATRGDGLCIEIDSANKQVTYTVTSITFNMNNWIDKIYPIGATYISTVEINPSTLFGGVWEQIKDRFLLANGDTYTNNSTGGSATVTLTSAQSGVPAHNHTYAHTDTTYKANTTSRKPGTSTAVNYVTSITGTANNTTKTSNNNTTANASQAHENMPPYLTVYMWKRIA